MWLIVSQGEDFLSIEYAEIGDNCFTRAFNNLAVFFSYCRLQLIQNFLTNDLVPPSQAVLQT
jgi:hypothetical protein